ncbi:CaiB/BaiF CoA transferase family protein [Neptunicoccus sediminis]|uniref:CaiB/BaiF CoA transferase family protein n=1 Tax=Neptunicoccus sediminis TaxID=1892596 RepID=UPI000845CF30|nr:CaiB/BaiF CoA-transferase family protein [Neptunicoccus sediminis]
MSNGPLHGVRIVEFAGLGPTPFAAMTLADMGAEVIRIQRPGLKHLMGLEYDILDRGRSFVELDLKNASDIETVKALLSEADALIEGMRPGVMERLGLGPQEVATLNPRLVYGRMTGWGQDGPLAHAAGHDINYIALSGALHAIGPKDTPVIPLNLIGDFGGGGMYMAYGIVCALFESTRSGLGQVVDTAITDGTAHLMSMIYAMQQGKAWSDRRESNILDGAAPFYGVYECACGGHVAIGAIEPKFYAELLHRIGADADLAETQMKRSTWPDVRAQFAAIFATKTRDAWSELLLGTDCCYAPVLTIEEAYHAPHNTARGHFKKNDEIAAPAPTPKLSRTPGLVQECFQNVPLNVKDVVQKWQETRKK